MKILLACVVQIETQAYASFIEDRARWVCEPCNARGPWTAPDKARSGAEHHIACVRKPREGFPL